MSEWHVILTLQMPLPGGGGIASGTRSTVLRVTGPTTREAIYAHMRSLFPDAFANADVVFFDLAPNAIAGGGAA